MNPAASEPLPSSPSASVAISRAEAPWPRRRWYLSIALVFAAQIVLIYAFNDRRPITPRQPTNVPQLRFAGSHNDVLALNDPTLFAIPNRNGFSAAAWLDVPGFSFHPLEWSETPRWFPMPVEQLGAVLGQFMRTNVFPEFALSLKPAPVLMLPKLPRIEFVAQQHSAIRVQGELAHRQWLQAPKLPAWPSADVLGESRVRVIVDAKGNVMSAVLLPPGSGSKAADQHALDLARTARFKPISPNAKTGTDLTSGTLIIQWQSAPPPGTNAPTILP